MDRVSLRAKFAGALVDYTLEEFDIPLKLRALSALDRARIVDRFAALQKLDVDNKVEKQTIQNQCYIVARGLMDDTGNPMYPDDELEKVAAEIPSKALDKISSQILEISGINAKAEPVKNLPPTSAESESSNSDLQPASVGGTSTDS